MAFGFGVDRLYGPVVPRPVAVQVTVSFVCDDDTTKLLAMDNEAPAGAVEVSLIVNVSVATVVPLVLPVLIVIVPVSAPSVVESAVGVIVNEAALLVTLNEPDDVLKSPEGDTTQ